MTNRTLLITTLLLLLAASTWTASAQTVEDLSPSELVALGETLGEQMRDCGCELTVAECLIDDPSCETSQALARDAIAELIAARSVTAAPRIERPAVGLESDGGEWFRRVNGKLLVYISTSAGGYREKDCTWLYDDGTFFNNNQTGSVTSLGSSASQNRDRGSWSVRSNVLTLVPPGAETQRYKMSVDSDGTFYLDNWRYFVVEHDHYTCQ